LFEQAKSATRTFHYAEARTLFEDLINRYPQSDLVPEAKLSIADAWYLEGSFKQAEMEYRDFIQFFPNRREVGYAQGRIDSIHKQAN
jgi:outer membrane protein assembly factor BamD